MRGSIAGINNETQIVSWKSDDWRGCGPTMRSWKRFSPGVLGLRMNQERGSSENLPDAVAALCMPLPHPDIITGPEETKS
jgi:hypothetical protein